VKEVLNQEISMDELGVEHFHAEKAVWHTSCSRTRSIAIIQVRKLLLSARTTDPLPVSMAVNFNAERQEYSTRSFPTIPPAVHMKEIVNIWLTTIVPRNS
jgi:ubiquitin-protein ligase